MELHFQRAVQRRAEMPRRRAGAQQPDLKNVGFDKEIIGMGIEELHQLIESEMSAQ